MDFQMQSTVVHDRVWRTSHVGRGSPTVILETGLGAESEDWTQVEREITSLASVFRYDRAGRGGSDTPVATRNAVEMIEELELVLAAADVRGPYVLVGHSFGGLLMRVFADRHRRDVRGLVLAESMHPSQFDLLGPAFPPPTPRESPALTAMRAFWTGEWRSPSATPERIDMATAFDQDRAIESLPDIPIRILTAGSFLREPPMERADHERLHGRWLELQRSFLALSPQASQTFEPASGHFMQRDAPMAIVDAIRELCPA